MGLTKTDGASLASAWLGSMGTRESQFRVTLLSKTNWIPREGMRTSLNELFSSENPHLVDDCFQQPIHRSWLCLIFIHLVVRKDFPAWSRQILEGIVRRHCFSKKQAQVLHLSQTPVSRMAGSAFEMSLPVAEAGLTKADNPFCQ